MCIISLIENVLIVDVPEGKNKPYSVNGRFYLRIGTNCQQLKRDEIRDLFKEEGSVRFDESFNNKFDIKTDLKHSAFKFFLEQAKISHVLKRENILENMMILENGRIRNAGVLLFCRNIKKFFIQGTISCFLYRGDDKYKILDQKEFSADLYSNYQDAMTYLQSHLNTEYIIKDGPREERLELPEEALREAILNAIAHRDYFSTANVQINIFKNRVEVVNSGGLIGKLTVKDLYEKSMGRKLLPATVIVEGVSEGVNLLFEYIRNNPGQRVPHFEQAVSVSKKTLERWVKKLKKEGKIEFLGSSKMGGYWEKKEKL